MADRLCGLRSTATVVSTQRIYSQLIAMRLGSRRMFSAYKIWKQDSGKLTT